MPSILFAVLTILVAYGCTIGLALALLFLTHATAPRWMGSKGEASPLFLLLNVGIWSLSAAAGGMLTGWLAQWHPNIVVFALACVLFSALLSVGMEPIGKPSLNYQVAVGRLRLRRCSRRRPHDAALPPAPHDLAGLKKKRPGLSPGLSIPAAGRWLEAQTDRHRKYPRALVRLRERTVSPSLAGELLTLGWLSTHT